MSQENQSYIGYKPTVKDPGHGLTAWTVFVCILVYCSLPLWLRLASRWDQYKARKLASNATTNAKGNVLQDDGSVLGKASSFSSSSSSPAPVNEALTWQNVFLHQLANNTSYRGHESRSISFRSFMSDNGARSTGSKKSIASSSSLVSMVASTVLSGGDRRRVGKNRSHTAPWYYHVVQSHVAQPPVNALDDVHTSDKQSDVNILDDDSVNPGNSISTFQKVIEEEDPDNSLWNQFLDIVDWDDESKRLMALTIPYTLQICTQGLFQMVNVAIIGNYVGVRQANAFVVVVVLLEFSGTLTYGFGEAIGTVVPQAAGTGNLLLAGRYLQLSQILYSVMALPAIIVWTSYTDDAVLWFGFDKETARISQEYANPFLVQVFLGGFNHGIHKFLSALGHEHYSAVVKIGYYAVDCMGVGIAISSGIKELQVIGTVQAFLGFVMSLLNVFYILYQGWMDEYWEGLVETLSLQDGRAVHTMVITALPLSISWLLTYGEWQVLTVFASSMGPAEVAAWAILGLIWNTLERITAGFADAAEVRVGFYMGAGQPQSAKITGYKLVYMALIASLLSTAVLLIIAGNLPRWMTPDPTLQKMIFEALPLIGFGQVLLIIGPISWGILAAQGRVRLATTIEFFTSWIVCIPLCSISLYVLNYDLKGFVAVLVFGYTLAGVTLNYIVLRSDWHSLSQTVISRNAIVGVSWQEIDWEELPTPIQTAALVLGYTKQLWALKEEPPLTGSKNWRELTSVKKEAALILGYTEKTWDDDISSTAGEEETE